MDIQLKISTKDPEKLSMSYKSVWNFKINLDTLKINPLQLRLNT